MIKYEEEKRERERVSGASYIRERWVTKRLDISCKASTLHSPHPSENKERNKGKKRKGSGEKKYSIYNPYTGASKTPVGKSYRRQS